MRSVKFGLSILVSLFSLGGCGEPDPVRIGFIGGLEGRASDIGIASRNAVQLGVDEVNTAGGINGRKVELYVRDDGGTAEGGAEAARALVGEKVDAIIGPNLSVVASGMVPVINEAGIVSISPTVSSLAFVGKDDYFYRIGSTTRQYATAYADFCEKAGIKRMAMTLDKRNAVFSESWLAEFRAAHEARGGEVIAAVSFDATVSGDFARVTREILETRPDALLFIANGVDSAQFAQQVRKLDPDIPFFAAEWAASESLFELGGRAIEGLILLQTYDRYDDRARYVSFRDAYRDRFQEDPGFSSVAAYDGLTALLAALRSGNENLKEAMDSVGSVEGLQQIVEFDAFGDSERRRVFVEARDGKFIRK
ncbi:MAG: ABC transporter substrate-binding protein [Nisaea sp.]|uniref:ABC transporter substrate-binding protein n=1 Tax=Nisaea sp. TaxID=2024842 RepID=UPI001B284D32|nr:ABC transporter substrate-binding protein [Nisaea sp.]MBO6558991.1 ABC transporter substrate-binding protein [Nisaea sp.]